jgi:hypothetical protein
MTVKTTVVLVSLAVVLAACGEKAQVAQTRKSDAQPWEGSSSPAFTVPGWKVGDQKSWEEEMRARTQGQNEYARPAAK